MRVLALTSYPVEAAATRFRLQQMVEPLRGHGIEVEIRPLLSSAAFEGLYDRSSTARTAWRLARAHLRRLGDAVESRHADVVLLQREAAILGPPVVEAVIRAVGRRPLVLDLDDPTWISYDSPTFGRVGRLAKWPAKTDWLIDRAVVVTCGSQSIADHVVQRGAAARLIPTVVDTEVFRPRQAREPRRLPLVGWIGTHSTLPYLTSIAPALGRVAAERGFRLLSIGGGNGLTAVDGVDVEDRPWSLRREVDDFRSLDVGLYPLADDEWARGKSAFKAIQYLACGVPFVVSPIGAASHIGVAGTTHLEAGTLDEWAEAVGRLVADPGLRATMGAAGRSYALEHYTVAKVAAALAAALHEAAGAVTG